MFKGLLKNKFGVASKFIKAEDITGENPKKACEALWNFNNL